MEANVAEKNTAGTAAENRELDEEFLAAYTTQVIGPGWD